MLKLVKKGENLKDHEMKSSSGGALAQCGENACQNCGDIGNDSMFMTSTIKWFWTPYY